MLMEVLQYAVVAAVVLALLCLVLLTHAGYFRTLLIRQAIPTQFPRRVAYKLHVGPYKEAGKAYWGLDAVARGYESFFAFYDDPDKVPQDQLRYIVGCCLPDGPAGKESDEEHLRRLGFHLWTFPKCSEAVITEFPVRSFLSMYIAPMVVYPSLVKYIKGRKLTAGPFFELCQSDMIKYIVPTSECDAFWVPEVTKKDL